MTGQNDVAVGVDNDSCGKLLRVAAMPISPPQLRLLSMTLPPVPMEGGEGAADTQEDGLLGSGGRRHRGQALILLSIFQCPTIM